MLSRAVAALLVMVLVGPSVATATCELTCTIGRHHHGTPSSSASSCHEHQGSQGTGVSATASSVCHDSADLPTAVVDAWLHAIGVIAVPVTTIVVTAPSTAHAIARAHERNAPFDPRPAHRPLRV